MPQDPTYSKQKVDTAGGEIAVHIFMAEPSATIAYSVMFNELPQKMREVAKEHSDVLFDGGQNSALGTDGKLLKRRDFKFHGLDARELQFVRFRTGLVTMRMYLTEDRLYQTISLVPTNQASSPTVVRFLDSFRLTK